MTFTRFSNHFDFDYKIHGLSVTRAGILVCDLGFHLSRNLNSRLYTEDICYKILKLLGYIQIIVHEFKLSG